MIIDRVANIRGRPAGLASFSPAIPAMDKTNDKTDEGPNGNCDPRDAQDNYGPKGQYIVQGICSRLVQPRFEEHQQAKAP